MSKVKIMELFVFFIFFVVLFQISQNRQKSLAKNPILELFFFIYIILALMTIKFLNILPTFQEKLPQEYFGLTSSNPLNFTKIIPDGEK